MLRCATARRGQAADGSSATGDVGSAGIRNAARPAGTRPLSPGSPHRRAMLACRDGTGGIDCGLYPQPREGSTELLS